VSVLDIPMQRTGELITPTGALISTAEPETDEWFAVRRAGITATDLPKILGLSKYGNARSVWHDKRGELPADEAGEEALWGQILEGPVADRWASLHDVSIRRVGVLANTTRPWMRVALDRIPDRCPDGGGLCALEIKTRSAYTAGKWRADVPDDVLAQVAYQRMTTGIDHVHVAALIGGQRMVEHRYDADPDLEAYLLAEASAVWAQVEAEEIPLVEPTAVLTEMLDRLFAHRTGDLDDEGGYALDLAEAYRHAQSLEREAEAAKEAVKAAVLDYMGDAERLLYDGEPVFTYRPQSKHSVNVTDLENHDVALYEEVLAGGHITSTTSRILRLSLKEKKA
jgi:putative phage-type endonuclease